MESNKIEIHPIPKDAIPNMRRSSSQEIYPPGYSFFIGNNHMRIITWNVRAANRKIMKLVSHALSYAPDVLCLQEVPQSRLPDIEKLGYHVVHSRDFVGRKKESKNSYTCILTKHRPISQKIATLHRTTHKSLMTRIMYSFIRGITEKHNAPIISIRYGDHILQIASTRLSCAISMGDRLAGIMSLAKELDPSVPAIVCGDLNIMDPNLLNILSGWTRGFTLKGYFLNERKEFERIITLFGFTNIFKNQSTFLTKIPRFQFDHILIPEEAKVIHQEIGKKLFGSDHRMLLVDIQLLR